MGDDAFSALAPDQRLRLVQRAVRELVGEGLLAIYRGRWDANERKRVAPEECSGILASWETWVPEDGPAVFIAGDEPRDPFTWRATLDSM